MKQSTHNIFQDGLNFDLNPLTTPNTVLTDALNASFITFNGDELSLQNDSGNTKIKAIYNTSTIYGSKLKYDYNEIVSDNGFYYRSKISNNDTDLSTVNWEDVTYVKLTNNYYPIGIIEYGGVLYIVSTNKIIDWNPNSKYFKFDQVQVEIDSIIRYFECINPIQSITRPDVDTTNWKEVIPGRIEFGSYPSPDKSGINPYYGLECIFTEEVDAGPILFKDEVLDSYGNCIQDETGRNTGYRTAIYNQRQSSDGINWTIVGTITKEVLDTLGYCTLPINLIAISVGTIEYDFLNENQLTYVENTNINFDSPIKSGYNYLFISIPQNRELYLLDSLGKSVPFSYVAVDDRPEYSKNFIYRTDIQYNTSTAVQFTLNIR